MQDIQVLVKHGLLTLNFPTGRQPLHVAAKHNPDPQALSYFIKELEVPVVIKHAISCNMTMTPLLYAAHRGNMAAVKFLLFNGENPEERDGNSLNLLGIIREYHPKLLIEVEGFI